MKLKSALYNTIWYLLRTLVYAKRGFVYTFSKVRKVFLAFSSWYNRTLGFRIFKAGFYARRRLFPQIRRGRSSWQLLGERWVLQFIGFAIGLTLVFPHTSFFKPEFGQLAGQKTLVYALVGPGEQDFALVEDMIEETALIVPQDAERWREGALVAQPQSDQGVDYLIENEGIGTTIGGALVKPVLVSTRNQEAVVNSAENQDKSADRSGVVEYQVQPGDVIGGIASRYGLSVKTVLTANHLTDRSLIRPGDMLKIPTADGVLHTIAKGDTLGKIAGLYGVSAENISKFNQGIGKNLKVGTQILIPGAKKTISAAKPAVTNNKLLPQKPQNKILSIPVPVSTGGYIWPSGARIITQYYGLRHTGVDIAGQIGLPNYAARSGQVVKSQCGWNGGYGCYIIIDHGNGIQTLYGHNSKLLVSPGEYVTQGQVIGLLGSTGRSTGPHLHFEVRINGHRTNPLQFVRH